MIYSKNRQRIQPNLGPLILLLLFLFFFISWTPRLHCLDVRLRLLPSSLSLFLYFFFIFFFSGLPSFRRERLGQVLVIDLENLVVCFNSKGINDRIIVKPLFLILLLLLLFFLNPSTSKVLIITIELFVLNDYMNLRERERKKKGAEEYEILEILAVKRSGVFSRCPFHL